MNQRAYTGAADLQRLQDFNAAAIAVTDHCGYLHPGDIPHHIYNGNRGYDPATLLTIWEDDGGIAAWVLANMRHKGFDAQVRPDLRGGAFEREVLTYAWERTVELMRRHDIAADYLYADGFRGDSARVEVLTALGWEKESGPPFSLTRTPIGDVAMPTLPDGFTFGAAQGLDDAAALAAVHSGAFGSSWTAESYAGVMQSPGYAPERELVIRAPDGAFAAFTIIWFDPLNRAGLFEPVGVHRDYHRRGLGRAILLHGMQHMAAAGMTTATVAHFGDNAAATGLYHACGFRPWHPIDSYRKACS